MSHSTNKSLIIFAKAPQNGQVKTRLIPELGEESATNIYRKLLHHVLNVSTQLADVDRELWCSEVVEGKCSAYADQYALSIHQQKGADLGERMHLALESVLQRYDRAVLIGSDSPEYDADYLQDAFTALEHKDCVIGPAEDGGYLLIGLKRPVPQLFEGIAWSSDQVLQQTRNRLTELKLSWHELATKRDIDEPQDLAQFPEFFLIEDIP